MQPLTILLLMALIVLFQSFPYTFYPMILRRMKKRPYEKFEDNELPPISIIIPTYNEESVIREKLESLLNLEYPAPLEIFIVDSASTDNTTEIVKNFLDEIDNSQGNKKFLLLTERERRGKISAINLASENASNNILVVTDANAFFDSLSLRELIRPLKDPFICVTGATYKTSSKNLMFSHFESAFRKMENKIADLEGDVDSTFATGELFALKKKLVPLEEDAIVDDAEASIKARKMGYKTMLTDAIVFEETPSEINTYIAYKSNRVFHTLRVLTRHKNMLFSPNYGVFGMLILPSRKLIPMLAPLSATLVMVLGISLLVTLLSVLAFPVILGLLGIIYLGTTLKHKWLTLISQAVIYHSILQLALLKGWIKLFTYKELYWEKVRQ